MEGKAAAARAEAARCVSLAHQNKDPSARAQYLHMAQSWALIAEHHEALTELDGKATRSA